MTIQIKETPNEAAAFDDAGAAGGEYLQSIGVFDLSQLTPEQYGALVRKIVYVFGDKLSELAREDMVKLRKIDATPF